MKFDKHFHSMILAALAVSFLLGFVACSDNEDMVKENEPILIPTSISVKSDTLMADGTNKYLEATYVFEYDENNVLKSILCSTNKGNGWLIYVSKDGVRRSKNGPLDIVHDAEKKIVTRLGSYLFSVDEEGYRTSNINLNNGGVGPISEQLSYDDKRNLKDVTIWMMYLDDVSNEYELYSKELVKNTVGYYFSPIKNMNYPKWLFSAIYVPLCKFNSGVNAVESTRFQDVNFVQNTVKNETFKYTVEKLQNNYPTLIREVYKMDETDKSTVNANVVYTIEYKSVDLK